MNILRSAATVSAMTLLSRVLGFVRDVAIAGFLGAGPVADAFVAAFQFPNLFRRLFAEGAFNAAFIPLFAKRLEAGGQAASWHFAEQALALLLPLLLLLTGLAIAFMPWLVYVIAPGFDGALAGTIKNALSGLFGMFGGAPATGLPDTGKLGLTIIFGRILFPYLLFVSLLALYSGILQSYGRFAVAAFAPVLLNVMAIGALLAAWAMDLAPGLSLVWAIAVSGLVQLLLVMGACARMGLTLRLRLPRLSPETRQFGVLFLPGLIAGGITQINLLIGGIIASFQAGARAWLYYADRIYQFPLGLVGVAVGIVLLPALARQLRSGDKAGAESAQNRALEGAMLLTLPAAAALAALALPITQTLFERGAFTGADAVATARALFVYALGLPAFVLIKVFSPAFFAREDTRTPLRFALYSVAVNIGLGLALFPPFGHVGMALATTLASWLNAGLLIARLRTLGHHTPDRRLQSRLPRIFAASILMGFAMGLLAVWLEPAWQGGIGQRLAVLSGLVLLGMVLYGGLVLVFRAAHLNDLQAGLRRKP